MRYLYLALVVSFLALLWAAVAIARHIRAHEQGENQQELEPADLTGLERNNVPETNVRPEKTGTREMQRRNKGK